MRNPKTYQLWGIFIAASGLIISLIVTAGILTGFIVPLILSPVLWRIPLAMLVVSGLCIVAGLALLIIALTSRVKKVASKYRY